MEEEEEEEEKGDEDGIWYRKLRHSIVSHLSLAIYITCLGWCGILAWMPTHLDLTYDPNDHLSSHFSLKKF